jgi:hypothetical protein
MSRVQFPALPHFLRNSGSGMGPTQERQVVRIVEELLEREIAAPVKINAREDSLHYHPTPFYPQKLKLASPGLLNTSIT